jgi:hypothetical protein
MPVKPTVSEYELNFFGGPAEGQVIKMFVEPTKVRYYCRQGSYTWWSIYPPERTVGTEVFEYKIAGHAPRKEGALLTYELVEEE